jgi:hypothetical protein
VIRAGALRGWLHELRLRRRRRRALEEAQRKWDDMCRPSPVPSWGGRTVTATIPLGRGFARVQLGAGIAIDLFPSGLIIDDDARRQCEAFLARYAARARAARPHSRSVAFAASATSLYISHVCADDRRACLVELVGGLEAAA